MILLLKRLILVMTIAATICIIPGKSFATHLVGSDITYTCLGGNTYRIDLTFYRDCRGSQAPLGVGIEFHSSSCNQYFTDTLLRVPPTGGEITYPCLTQVTSCSDPASTNPGIQQYHFSGIVTLPMQCSDWIISWSYCCRNCDITTITLSSPCVPDQNPGMYVAATLDNLNVTCNSSPRFTNIPVAFLCIGQHFTYNHGVIDPNGDSLAYSLVNPMRNSTDSVPFIAPYSATNPISSAPALSINPVTGDLVMTPTQAEVGVLSVLVQEFRNGVLIGSVIRDMEIYVRACNDNLPTVSGINGGVSRDTSVCPGQNLCFDVFSDDLDSGQIVSMSWNQGIQGATFTVSGFPHPSGHFCWTPPLSATSAPVYEFTVTVLDDACPQNGFQTYAFTVDIVSPVNNITTIPISCHGATDASATVVPSSPGNNYSYLWSPGNQTTASINGLGPGVYSVTVVDTITGCTSIQSDTVTDPAVISTSTRVNSSPCAGTNNGVAVAVASGGSPGYTYSWDTAPPIVNDTATGLPAGTFHVTVTDSHGCTAVDSVTVSAAPSAVTVTVNSFTSALQCHGDANGQAFVTGSGGTPGYTYSWNTIPPQNGQQATGLTAGVHTVVVTDSLGCTATDSVTITEPPVLVLTGTSTPAGCGQSNGSVSVSVSGGVPFTAGYHYLWTPGNDTTAAVAGLPAQVYTVVVTDSNSCTSQLPVGVSNSGIPQPLAIATANNLCFGDTNGSAVVRPQGGTPPFTFTWNTVPVQTDSIAIHLPAGLYVAGVVDSNGCTSFDTVEIVQPPRLSANAASTNVSCSGDSSATAQALVSGGVPSYAYQWSPYGGTGSVANNLGTGTFVVTITDANLCTTTAGVTITQPAPIAITVNAVTDPACYAGNDGSIDISVSGGTGSYIYFWNPGGALSQDLTNIDAGIYIVTITDQHGCTTQSTVHVNQPSPVSVNAGADTALCTGRQIQLQATLASGQSGLWSSSSGATFMNASDPNTTVSNLLPGVNVLTWTVTNATGCSNSATVSIFNFSNVIPDAGPDTSFCGYAQIILQANSFPGFSGQWSSSGGTQFTNATSPNSEANVSNYGADTLHWTITNNLCVASDYLLVRADEPVQADAGAYQSVCVSGASLVALNAPLGQGLWTINAPGTGVIQDPSNHTTQVINLNPGLTVLTWQVTNGRCSASDTASVYYNDACEIELPSGFSPNGDGYNDGYYIKSIEAYPDNKLVVYNRWGNEVYSKDHYANSDWKGQNKSGDPLPEGTYFVILEVYHPSIRLSTYVDLRRFTGK